MLKGANKDPRWAVRWHHGQGACKPDSALGLLIARVILQEKKRQENKERLQSAFHPSEKKKVFRHKVLGQLILCLFLFILYWKNYSSEIRGRRITAVTCEVLAHFAIRMQKSSFLSYESLKTKPKAPKPKQNKSPVHINRQEFSILFHFHMHISLCYWWLWLTEHF